MRRDNERRRSFNGRTDLALAAQKRLADSRRLIETSDPTHARGAAYLAGYAVECRLKALAMEVFDCWTLDELAGRWSVSQDVVYTHGLESIARRLPFWDRLLRNEQVRRRFARVNEWKPSWRYDGRDWAVDEANEFLGFVMELLEWLTFNR